MSKVYLSVHSSGEGPLGISVCLRIGSVVCQSDAVKNFSVGDKSIVELNKTMCQFDELEVGEDDLLSIMGGCSDWSKYDI